MKLAVILSHPTQYYSPWFRWVVAHSDLRLRVFYLWEFGATVQRDRQFDRTFRWDVDLTCGYDCEFVPNVARDPGTHHFFGLRNPDLLPRLEAWKPDAMLVFGYKWASVLRAIVWGRQRGIPVLFRGDSHFLGRGRPSLAARAVLGTVYRQCQAFLYVGAANRAYFRALGIPNDRLFFAPHAVDHSLFDGANLRHHAAATELRARLAIPAGNRVVLFAGKFIPAKQPLELLEAFLTASLPATTLVMVGDGSEKPKLEQRVAQSGTREVRFLPFTNQSQMPATYLLADIFVLPSRGHYETWGLAVNEAMHMGVPALVSTLVGCQQDLVTDGETGWVFDPTEPGALAAALRRACAALATAEQRERVRQAVSTRISDYTFAQATAGLQQAIAASCHSPATR